MPAAAVTKRVHAIVTSLHFAFANEPRHYRGQVAAKLANYLSPTMATKRFNDPIEPMTLGNMRANGMRSLDVSCWLPQRRSLARRRARAKVRAADARPNWREKVRQ